MGSELEKKELIFKDNKVYATNDYLNHFSPMPSLPEQPIDSLQNAFWKIQLYGKGVRQGYFDLEQGIQLAEKLKIKFNFDPTEVRIRNKDAEVPFGYNFYEDPDNFKHGNYVFTIKGKGDMERPEVERKISESFFNKHWEDTIDKRIYKIRYVEQLIDHKVESDLYLDRPALIVVEREAKNMHQYNNFKVYGKDVTKDKSLKNANMAKTVISKV